MSNQVLFLASFFLVFSSCSSNDNKLCECVNKGAVLNKLSQEALNTPVVSKEQQAKIEALRKEMREACESFQMMPTAELQQKKQSCKSLEINAE